MPIKVTKPTRLEPPATILDIITVSTYQTHAPYMQRRLPAFKPLTIHSRERKSSQSTMALDSSSPKRKRNEQSTPKKPSPSKISTSFTAASLVDNETGSESPRTQVSANFENLQLDGSGVSKLIFTRDYPQRDSSMDEMDKVRKKPKVSKFQIGQDIEIPETPTQMGHHISPEFQHQEHIFNPDPSTFLSPKLDPMVFKGIADLKASTGKLSKSYPSINRLSESQSRVHKKALCTTPLESGAEVPSSSLPDDLDVDEVRGSLTWHDDELTVFDPDDPDDDGEGIDGVGFRPTAARADARQLKKKRQLDEWRNRESREARAKRFERRTASAEPTTRDNSESPRKVRFSDVDANVMISQ